VVDVTKKIIDTNQELIEKHHGLVQNVTSVIDVKNRTLLNVLVKVAPLVRNTGQTLNQKILTLEMEIERCKQHVNQNMLKLDVASNESLSGVSTLPIVHTCPRSESTSGVYLLN